MLLEKCHAMPFRIVAQRVAFEELVALRTSRIVLAIVIDLIRLGSSIKLRFNYDMLRIRQLPFGSRSSGP
jgi:hypothetical protein